MYLADAYFSLEIKQPICFGIQGIMPITDAPEYTPLIL